MDVDAVPCPEALPCTRRSWIAVAAGVLGGCAGLGLVPPDRIIDTESGQSLMPADVVGRMRRADIVLLGELHDNPHHHTRRAELIAALGLPATVVAEHLPRAAAPKPAQDAGSDALRQALEASGFDAKGWRWPLHEPLFAAIARAGLPLRGGNLERDAARRLAREGAVAMPADLAPWLAAAPLTGTARAALEDDMIQGHCGHIGASRLPGMVAAQQGRDAAMAQALMGALAARAERAAARPPGPAPVLLLAGNGHVRRDYGVPALLRQRLADARVLTVGFVEHTAGATVAPGRLYDIVWSTPPAVRDDPCKAFIPRPAAPAASR
jgi:uncharacterized iron-regulated protein